MLKPIAAVPNEAPAASAERTSPERWALAGLALAMLLSSLGTSSANVALPTLALVIGGGYFLCAPPINRLMHGVK